jgi:pimeloyl-ACP methyl ester carboxylesterase
VNAPRAQPLHFGPIDQPLFGWLHPPRPSVRATTGLVLCNPFGYETISTHRTYRHCAEKAAQAGIPALRFDYHGTGDSAGTDSDAQRLGAWLTGIGHAVATLRQLSDVQRVCLFGVRLGATIAALAAQELPEVCALIAVNPVVNGRGYLRELRMLATAGQRPRSRPEAGSVPGPSEVAGFAISEETQADLLTLDLLHLGRLPLRHVLLIERLDLPVDDSLPRHFSGLGIEVTRQAFGGYAEMMLEAHETVVPDKMLDESLVWLGSLDAPTPGIELVQSVPPVCSVAPFARISLKNDHGECRIRETPVFLDESCRLFGIVSEPDEVAGHGTRASRQVLLLLNSGAVHHVGPNRLYVSLARACASWGVTVIRMDISGIGDSQPHPGETENVVYTTYALADIAQAVSFAQARVHSAEVHCAGICSGAYHGFKAAVSGLPLGSLAIINPLTFFWKEGMSLAQPEYRVAAEAIRYRRAVMRPSSWLKLLRGRVELAAVRQVITGRLVGLARDAVREICRMLRIALRDDLAKELHLVAKHGTQMLFVFAASDPGLPMLRAQGGVAVTRLQRTGMLQIETIDGADHTFTPQWTQNRLLCLLTAQFTQTCPPASR